MAIPVTYYFDVVKNAWVFADGSLITSVNFQPFGFYGQTLTIELHVIEVVSGVVSVHDMSAATSFYLAIENDWVLESQGILQTNIPAGTVPNFEISGLDKVPFPTGGTVRLYDGSNYESVEYATAVLSGSNYLFTPVSGQTVTNSYVITDEADYIDVQLALAENADIDSTQKADGIFTITLSLLTAPLLDVLEGNPRVDAALEFGAIDATTEPVEIIQSNFVARFVKHREGIAPPTSPTNDYRTATLQDAIDATHMPKLSGGVAGNTVIISSDGETIEDAGVAPGGGGSGTIDTDSVTKVQKRIAVWEDSDTITQPDTSDAPWIESDGTLYVPNQIITATVDGEDSTQTVTISGVVNAAGALTALTVTVNDDAYDASDWNGILTVPTKNAIRDALVALEAQLDSGFVPLDLTSLPIKTVVEGDEFFYAYDNGVFTRMRTGLFATPGDIPSGIQEIRTSADDLERDDNLKPVLAIYSETDQQPLGSDIILIVHANEDVPDQTFPDRSSFAHVPTLIGATGPVTTITGWKGNAIDFDGVDEGIDYDPTNFVLGNDNFVIGAFFYVGSGNGSQTATLIALTGGQPAFQEVLRIRIAAGQLQIDFAEAGSLVFTDSLNYAITITEQVWLHVALVRDGENLYPLFNGEVLDTYPIGTRSIAAVTSQATEAQWKYGYDVSEDSIGLVDGDFYTGELDELLVQINGTNLITISGSTYTVPTSEYYVTQTYDITAASTNGAFELDFVEADLDSNGDLTLNHMLDQRVLTWALSDNNGNFIIPDNLLFVDNNSATLNVATLQPLTGTWVIVLKNNIAQGGGGSEIVPTHQSPDASLSITESSDGLTVDMEINTSNPNEYTAQQTIIEAELVDGANISWNLDNAQTARVTLAGNRQLDNPTNMKAGGTYILRVSQDSGGANTLSFDTAYQWEGGTAPTITATGSAVDLLAFYCDGTNMYGSVVQDYS